MRRFELTRVILVRHGETYWNEAKLVQGGRRDIDLNPNGREQAERLGLALKQERLTAIYASPLKRALDTAQAIARHHSLMVETDPDLKEIDAGELDGVPHQVLRTKFDLFLAQWKRNPAVLRMPGGESLAELQDRAWGSIRRILDRHPGGSVAVVSHNFAITTIICKALDIELCHFRRLRPEVAGISVLVFGERGATLALFNDTCHLTASG